MLSKRILTMLLAGLLLLTLAVACSAAEEVDEAEEVEVTRVVTEEESVAEGETVAVEVTPTPAATGSAVVETETTAEEVEDGPGADASGTEPGEIEAEDVTGPGVGPKGGDTVPPQATLAPAGDAVPERAEAGTSAGDETEAAVAEPAGLPEESLLTAGAVDDNAEWNAYLTYLQSYDGPDVLPVDVSQRHQITVLDELERPVLGALVVVSDNSFELVRLRTHSDGRVYIFPAIFSVQRDSYDIAVTVNGVTVETTLAVAGDQREWLLIHPGGSATGNVNLDILFLLDATGSMGDEIQQLKDNIEASAAQIDALPAQPDVRYGMVLYRDGGDEFVVKNYDFTPDLATFQLFLAEVTAAGGGDYPEDLHRGLDTALTMQDWRVENTVSLIFLIADAPPKLNNSFLDFTYVDGMVLAAELGIKIFPIASSNLNDQGEYIFRQMAQFTGAQFIFLTYGEDGPGTTGGETDLQVEGYTVTMLDELVVLLVAAELAHQTP